MLSFKIDHIESFTLTKGSLHRISRRLAVCLAKGLCLFVKQIHLRLHKLGLNFDEFFEILGLTKFLHERKSSSHVLQCIAQKYYV
jgi:hypothetical protein